jgi:flagellar biosynthesis/type III secretory pathway protein FliH
MAYFDSHGQHDVWHVPVHNFRMSKRKPLKDAAALQKESIERNVDQKEIQRRKLAAEKEQNQEKKTENAKKDTAQKEKAFQYFIANGVTTTTNEAYVNTRERSRLTLLEQNRTRRGLSVTDVVTLFLDGMFLSQDVLYSLSRRIRSHW